MNGGSIIVGGAIPVLCGGTFFTLLLRARKQRQELRENYSDEGKRDRERDLFARLIKVCDSDYVKPQDKTVDDETLKSITSKYRSCTLSKSECLPFTDSAVIENFNNRVKGNYPNTLEDMQSFINDFLDTNPSGRKITQLVKELFEIIEHDKSIKKTDVFFMCPEGKTMSKSDLCVSDGNLPELNVCLPALLLGIWHFIVVHRPENTIGKATFDSWHEDDKYKTKGKKKNFILGKIGVKVKRKIKITGIDGIDKTTDDSDNAIDTASSNNGSQVHNAAIDLGNESDVHEIESPKNDTPYDEMLKIFKEAVNHCDIKEFIESDPSYCLAPNMLSLVARFIDTIQFDIVNLYSHCSKDTLYKNISRFVHLVNEYNNYLEKNMQRTQGMLGILAPIHRYEGVNVDWQVEFKETTDHYLQRLKSLYKEITGEDI